MTDNRTTELQSLSKLKIAGRLRYWRGTIEIPETELHAICDEIQEEHDQAIAATLGSEREKALEELVRDMWFWGYEGHMDSESQDWQMKHIDGVLDRMKELGIGVIDE